MRTFLSQLSRVCVIFNLFKYPFCISFIFQRKFSNLLKTTLFLFNNNPSTFSIMKSNSRSSKNVRNQRKLNMRMRSRRNRYGSFLAYSLNYALSIPVLFLVHVSFTCMYRLLRVARLMYCLDEQLLSTSYLVPASH